MSTGRMTVQLYERDSGHPIRTLGAPVPSTERGEAEVGVLAVVISHGDDLVQVSLDEEGKWEIELIGESVIHHH